MIKLGKTSPPAPPAPPAASPAQPAPLAAPAQTGASLAARLTGGSAEELAKMLSSSKFLPSFRLMHPIDRPELGLAGACVVESDGSVQKLTAPFRVCVLGVRYAARRLDPQPDGSKKYVRGYKGGKSDAEYTKLCAESKEKGDRNMLGRTALVAVLTGDKAAVCSCDLFATGGSYWEKPFAAGLFAAQACIVVTTDNHLGNLKNSPNDKTKSFYAKEKFRQWQPEELTPDRAKLIVAAVEANAEGVEDWANK